MVRSASWSGKWRHFHSIAVMTAFLSALSPIARAENVSAEALFRAGRAAASRGDHNAACTHYRESYRLEPALGTLLNLAMCEEALGRFATAWQHYKDASRDLSAEDQRFSWTKERLAALEGRVARLTIHVVPETAAKTRVVVGSIELDSAQLGSSFALDPGTHEISVLAAERAARKYTVEVAEGESKVLTLEAGPELGSARKPSASAPKQTNVKADELTSTSAQEGANARKVVAYSALGVGAVGLVTSAVALGFVLDRKATVDANCDANRRCTDEGLAAGSSGDDWLAVAGVGLAVAVVANAAGLYLLWAPDPKTSIGLQPGSHPTSGRLFLNHKF